MSTAKKSAKVLSIRSMKQITSETKSYIDGRKKGTIKSLKVSSSKINEAIMDGFDWNRIITIAGLSGSGKSTISRQWVKEMIELNEEKFEILSFQFEMLGIDEVARDLAGSARCNIKEIYSAGNALTDEKQAKLNELLDSFSTYPISVVDTAGTVSDIRDTILYYIHENNLIEKNTGLVVTIDHTLLVKPNEHEDEKIVVDNLMKTLVELKKVISSIGGKVLFFVLSQLNRNIETNERIINSKLHYPNKNDIFGASSVYYSSDYVIIIHRPAIIEGIGNWYGPPKKNFPQGLPVFNPSKSSQSMIYLHIIKERFGMNRIIPMLDDLEYSKIVEHSFKS